MGGWLAGLAEAAGGLLLIGLVLWDIFQTVVLPRPAPTRVRIARNLVRLTWPLWRWRALKRTSSIDQEELLGSYAPATVLILLITWFLLMVLGFGLLLYSLRDGLQPVSDFGSILYYAGTSLLTIGFGDITATHGLARLVSVVAGGLGLGTLALGITYLFSLYGSFQRREILVVRLEARAGAPPSGIRLLESYGAEDLRPGLAAFFLEWEAWAAEVLDCHVAYPILPYFRSSHDNVSWVSALGAVLDASALVLTTIGRAYRRGDHGPARRRTFRRGPFEFLRMAKRADGPRRALRVRCSLRAAQSGGVANPGPGSGLAGIRRTAVGVRGAAQRHGALLGHATGAVDRRPRGGPSPAARRKLLTRRCWAP